MSTRTSRFQAFAQGLVGIVSGSLSIAGPALAQDASKGVSQLERVEVTGSSIKRIEGETALPMQILTRADIARTGVSSVEQLLKMVTATSTLGAASVANTGAGGGQGGTNSVSLISLRGLGSARTLVLINGRRSASSGGTGAVDISSIALETIERVEVLKDGASAIYGSDAVAGVVNFILRRNFSGLELTGTLGSPTRAGGGDEKRVAAFGGLGDFEADRYNVTLAAGYHTVQPIFGSQRSFARNLDVDHQLDKTSTTAFPGNIRLNNGQLVSANYPNCGPYSIVSPLNPGLCRYDNAPFVAIQPETKLATVAATGRVKVLTFAEAYAEANFARNKTLNTTQHVLINGAALPAGAPYIATLTNLLNTQYPQFPQLRSLIGSAWALLPPTSPYYPTTFANSHGLTGQPLVLLFRSIPTGVRKTEDVEDNSRVVAGVRGSALGWDFDSGVLYSKNKIETSLTGGWAEFDKYLGLLNTGAINPFGPTSDPAALDAAMNSNFNGLFNTTTTTIKGADVKASRDLYQLPAGMASVALGAEFRRESLNIDPSDANKQFLVAGFGAAGVPVSASRKVASAYAEVNVPVIKRLEADAAVRFDKYQQVGNTTNPKGSLRWQPLDSVLLRAAVGTGFRAPTLLDLYQPPARGITTNGSRDLVRCPIGTTGLIDCSTQFVTIGGGNPALQPEKSRSITFGGVYEPTKNYSVGLDYFDIQVKEIIRAGLTTATILGDPVRYANFIFRGPPDGNPSGVGPIIGIDQSLTNLGKTKVKGFDVDLKGRVFATPDDKLTGHFNGTYFTHYDQQNLDGSFTSGLNQPAAIGIGALIRWRYVASLTWDTGPWSSTVTQNYQAGYRDLRTSLQAATVTPRSVSAYSTIDLQTTYTAFKSTKLTAGMKNALNSDPPYTNYGAGFVGGYDLSYADVRGRFVYVTAMYMF